MREREREQDVECQCTVLNESVRNSCTTDLASQQSAEAWRSAAETDVALGCSAKGIVCPLLVKINPAVLRRGDTLSSYTQLQMFLKLI